MGMHNVNISVFTMAVTNSVIAVTAIAFRDKEIGVLYVAVPIGS